jgi:hypothetical protein
VEKVLGNIVVGLLLLALTMIVLGTNDAPVLSSAEYAIDSAAAIQDRAGARAHAEAMASIEAERTESIEAWRTYRAFGYMGIGALAVVLGVGIYGFAAVRRARLSSGSIYVIEQRHGRKEIEGR